MCPCPPRSANRTGWLPAKLRVLEVEEWSKTDDEAAGPRALSRLTSLRALRLSRLTEDPDSLQPLGALTQLRALVVQWRCHETEPEPALQDALRGMQQLQHFGIYGCTVQVPHLPALTSVESGCEQSPWFSEKPRQLDLPATTCGQLACLRSDVHTLADKPTMLQQLSQLQVRASSVRLSTASSAARMRPLAALLPPAHASPRGLRTQGGRA